MEYACNKKGWIEVICGCMFSGKTTELIARIEKCQAAGQRVQVFNSTIDKRYATESIATHNNKKISAVHVEKIEDVLPLVKKNTQVVALDEINFFSKHTAEVAKELADRGIRVICSGLDMDFKAVPFESTAYILGVAERVDKLFAVCSCCGEPASRTQRTVDGKARILVGGSDSYEPRCAKCHTHS